MATVKQSSHLRTHNRLIGGKTLKKKKKVQHCSQFYLEDGRMFQSALDLNLVGHALDHSRLVHGFFVNLQTEELKWMKKMNLILVAFNLLMWSEGS